jgi:hypothetical protein
MRRPPNTQASSHEARHTSSPAPAGTYLRSEEQQRLAQAPQKQHLKGDRARLERIPASGACYRISDRDPVANRSFQVLIPIPAPDLGPELGTVMPSPPGTNQWAVVLGVAGVARLEETQMLNLRVGDTSVISVDIEFEGTQVLSLKVSNPLDNHRCD